MEFHLPWQKQSFGSLFLSEKQLQKAVQAVLLDLEWLCDCNAFHAAGEEQGARTPVLKGHAPMAVKYFGCLAGGHE